MAARLQVIWFACRMTGRKGLGIRCCPLHALSRYDIFSIALVRIRLQSQRAYDIFRLGLILAGIAVFLLWRGAGHTASAIRAARSGTIRKARITSIV